MKKTIPLSVISDAIEEISDGWQHYYNVITGEVEAIPSLDNDYVDFADFQETIDSICGSDDFIPLPTQRELDEYHIMERFAQAQNSEPLFRALRGRKPFRRFKDKLYQLDLTQEYYAFRSASFEDIARVWCRDHEVPFTEAGQSARTALTMNLYYTGKHGAARRFASEMEASGTAAAIRAEPGNLRYEYFLPLSDPETILLIDSWRDQAALDAHHASPMMAKIAALREKYDLHMRAERYVGPEQPDDAFIRT